MSVSKSFRQVIALALLLTSFSPAVHASASPSEQRAVCSKSRATVAPCTQTLTGTVGSAVSPTQRLVVSGIRENLSVSLKGQSLPAGLRLNKQTGVISGTPSSAQAAKNFFLYVSSGRDDKHSSESGLVAVVNITISGSTPPPPTTYSITASAGANGTITPSGVGQVNSGGSATYTFTPATGYHVSAVSVDSTDLAGPDLANAISGGYTFSNVTANHTIAVSFAINTYTVTASVVGSNGTISLPGVNTYNSGANSDTFTFTPATGYHVSAVSVDSTDLAGPDLANAISGGYTFSNLTANHTIAVSFAINTYTVTASVVGSNGTISLAGVNTYNYGANSDTFTFSPATGYHVSAVSVDGTDLSGADLTNAISSGYTFSNLTANHLISVAFASSGYTITFDSNVTQSGLTSTTHKQTGSGTVTLDANDYVATDLAHFYGWNTKSDGTGTMYLEGASFNLNSDTTLYAIWYFNVTFTSDYLDPGGAPSGYLQAEVNQVMTPGTAIALDTSIGSGQSVTYKLMAHSSQNMRVYFTGPYDQYYVTTSPAFSVATIGALAGAYLIYPSLIGVYFNFDYVVCDGTITINWMGA